MVRQSLVGSAWLSRAMLAIHKHHEWSKVDAVSVGQHAFLAHKIGRIRWSLLPRASRNPPKLEGSTLPAIPALRW